MLVDRRRQLRVAGQFPLSWRLNTLDSRAGEDAAMGDHSQEAQLASVQKELEVMLARLGGHSPEIAAVFERLNHKVDLVARQISSQIPPSMLCHLDLSHTGIGFDWPCEVRPGSRLIVSVLLPSSMAPVQLAVVVLASGAGANGAHRVRGRFEAGQADALAEVGAFIEWHQEARRGATG